MGLAPYGEPKYVDAILDNLIDLREDGSFRLDLSYFDFCTGLRMTNERFHELFGAPPRKPESPPTQRDMDLAASIQAVIEEAVLRLTRQAARETRARNLCLAGGVALNVKSNQKLIEYLGPEGEPAIDHTVGQNQPGASGHSRSLHGAVTAPAPLCRCGRRDDRRRRSR